MFILAPTSPRRKELFSLISKDFKIVAPNFDESKIDKSTNHLALIESKGKAYSIKNLVNPEDIIISCDTIVTLNGEVFGKPKNFEDAFLTLKTL